MKRHEVINLSQALSDKGFKAKHLSNESYVGLTWLKRDISKWRTQAGEAETALIDDFKEVVEMTQAGIMPLKDAKEDDVKNFYAKLLDVQKSMTFNPKQLNFIPVDEFRKAVEDADSEVSFTLAEYLLRDEVLKPEPKLVLTESNGQS